MRLTLWVGVLVVGLCVACGEDVIRPAVDAGDEDAGSGCRVDSDCSDGVFCNGIERCLPTHASADEGGCIAGSAPRCADGLSCTTDTCSHVANACRFVPIDTDGDGHAPVSCVTSEGEALGDDCDDNDANCFPGNPETCTVETEAHDEDCDPNTIGSRDLDGDTATASACCNGAHCGDDCADDNPRRGSEYPEVCDEVDNDCDENVDEDAIARAWYPDLDGDGFGNNDGTAVDSCTPVAGHSLFGTDCNDSEARLNPAAMEICDGADNDCDNAIDEGDVCSCGVPGAEPCECVAGAVECLGDLIPRTCVSGFWVAGRSCSGLTPICLSGRCVCADGGTRCTSVVDRSPPFVLATAPGADTLHVPTVDVVTVILSEPPAAASVTPSTFRVFDDRDVAVPGERTVEGQLVSFTPDAPFLPGRIYHVVFENVTDRAGNVMRATTAWRFATERAGYPADVIVTVPSDASGGFGGPVLRTSPAGDAALWVNTSFGGSDYVYSGSDLLRRTPEGVWSSEGWPGDTDPPPFAIGSGGLIAAFAPGATALDLLRRTDSDIAWNVLPTAYQEPAAIAVVGDRVVTAAMTANELYVFVEAATASGTDPPVRVSGFPDLASAVDIAVDALADGTIAVLVLQADQAIACHYANGMWNTRSIIAFMPSEPSVALRDDGTAVMSWLHMADIPGPPGGPSLFGPVHHVAFFDAASTALTPFAQNNMHGHSAPQVAWLDDTTVMASHSEPGPVANVVSAAGTIVSRLSPQGRLGGTATSTVDIAVLPNGDAMAVWVHGASFFGPSSLLLARYVVGAWQPVEVISESPSSTPPQIEALPDNTALLTWGEVNPSRGMAMVIR